MIRPDYRYFRRYPTVIIHSAKGSTWEEHKYIKRIDGTYYYPSSYEGGRHLPGASSGKKESSSSDKKSDGKTPTGNTIEDSLPDKNLEDALKPIKQYDPYEGMEDWEKSLYTKLTDLMEDVDTKSEFTSFRKLVKQYSDDDFFKKLEYTLGKDTEKAAAKKAAEEAQQKAEEEYEAAVAERERLVEEEERKYQEAKEKGEKYVKQKIPKVPALKKTKAVAEEVDEEALTDKEKATYKKFKKDLAKMSGKSDLTDKDVQEMVKKVKSHYEDIANATNLSTKDIDSLALEVLGGKFGDTDNQKVLLGTNYKEINARVKEIQKERANAEKEKKKAEEKAKKEKEKAEKALQKALAKSGSKSTSSKSRSKKSSSSSSSSSGSASSSSSRSSSSGLKSSSKATTASKGLNLNKVYSVYKKKK